ncbi:MAG: glutamate racemase [Acidobacteriales bacterium]|nr:glutamate racemase [Terriglobales bacterium]
MKQRPLIGVFDSGVGGLTVLAELLRQVPNADYVYFGDTARLPYGSKSAATVAKYAIGAAHYLEQQGIDFLVIGCNTACAQAYDSVRAAVKTPMIGVIEPGAEAAAGVSRKKDVIVLATEGTVNSHAYRKALEARGIKAEEKACPLFVPLVEEGWGEHSVTEQVAHIYLDDLFKGAADVMVLGCTHYPLLRPLLRRITPERIQIIDSAESTARKVAEALPHAASGGVSAPDVRFFATDSVEKFRRAGEKFLGQRIVDVTHVDLES